MTKLKAQDLLAVTSANITITDGVATVNNKVIQDECFALLGTDLATVKNSQDAVAMTNNAVAQSFSDLAQDYMADNKEATEVTAKTSIGEETLHLSSRRDMETRNPTTGETTAHKGALTVRRVIKNRNSELVNIKTLAKERGLNKL